MACKPRDYSSGRKSVVTWANGFQVLTSNTGLISGGVFFSAYVFLKYVMWITVNCCSVFTGKYKIKEIIILSVQQIVSLSAQKSE